ERGEPRPAHEFPILMCRQGGCGRLRCVNSLNELLPAFEGQLAQKPSNLFRVLRWVCEQEPLDGVERIDVRGLREQFWCRCGDKGKGDPRSVVSRQSEPLQRVDDSIPEGLLGQCPREGRNKFRISSHESADASKKVKRQQIFGGLQPFEV